MVSVSSQISLRILIRMLKILFVPESFLFVPGLGVCFCVSICLLAATGFFSRGDVRWGASLWEGRDYFPRSYGGGSAGCCVQLSSALLPGQVSSHTSGTLTAHHQASLLGQLGIPQMPESPIHENSLELPSHSLCSFKFIH